MLLTKKSVCIAVIATGLALAVCVTAHAQDAKKGKHGKSASETANESADAAMYQPVEYVNKSKPGPQLVVIPGEIKSSNVDFTQKITPNNIADFAELELANANFKVLERSDLGPMMQELQIAANMGSVDDLKKFKKGKFASTKWLIKFDILKAEPVAAAKKGFNGAGLGAMVGGVLGGRGGQVAGTGVSTVQTGQTAGIWIIGMRYKQLDASTGEQVGTGYKEQKMEIGSKGSSVLGISHEKSAGVGLDTMVQRLVQECVQEIDKNK